MQSPAPLSIIIPTHNRAGLVGDAIESALGLCRLGISPEVIVVNDGSSDRTSQVLEGFGAAITTIETAHGERSRARNAGLAAAGAPLVGFLDDDDLCRPEGWVRLLDELAANSELDFVFGRALFEDIKGQLLPYQPHPERLSQDQLFFSLLSVGCEICMGTAIVRRGKLAAVGGFDDSINAWEDWDLWLRLAFCGRGAFVDVPCASIRNPGWDSPDSDHHWAEKLTVRGRHALGNKQFPFLKSSISAEVLAHFLEQLACDAFTHRNHSTSRQAFQRLLDISPSALANPKRAAQLVLTLVGSCKG